jgi:hypothetical protein
MPHPGDSVYFSYRVPQELSNMAYARHLDDTQRSVPEAHAWRRRAAGPPGRDAGAVGLQRHLAPPLVCRQYNAMTLGGLADGYP